MKIIDNPFQSVSNRGGRFQMKKQSLIIVVTAMMIVHSLVVTIANADPGPDYDLLIITPPEFADELVPLQQFKNATCRPTIIVTLDYIYTHYYGADEAEEIKQCIADYEADHNIKYVLLVGDVDKLPMRYFYLKRENSTDVGWLQFYLTDHYYADLYNGGSFCSWDANGNGLIGEIFDGDNDGDYTNSDGIDFTFDVVVGRIPVDTEDEVEIYVDKIITYETEVSATDAWYNKILLATGTGGWVYPTDPDTWDENESDDLAAEMAGAGFSSIKLYHTNPMGSTYPNPGNINDNLNAGVGFMNVISHGNEFSWGVYDVRTDMSSLTNDDRLTVVYSFGCSTAKLGPIAAADPYIDISGVYQDYGVMYDSSYYPHPQSTWVEPAVPDCLQDAMTDIDCMPEYWTFDSENGAVAFIGSTAEASGAMGAPVMEYFFESIASDGHRVLGDVWNSVCGKVTSGGHSIGTDWDHARRWLYINVFGDPSLVLGGLDDKPPVTSLSIGTPQYDDAGRTYVTDTTGFTLTATDDGGIIDTYYLYYPVSSPSSIWSPGTTFTLSGSDGDYLIWYYSVDTVGNIDYPLKSREVTLDTHAPITTLSIGTPQYAPGADTYITTGTPLTLGASDTGSGVHHVEYQIDGAGWITYDDSAFHVTGSDGPHTISYRSVDNLGTIETTQHQVVLLDNTPPEITLTIGSPQYGTTPLWVTSATPFTITLTDDGSGPSHSQYQIDSGVFLPYAGSFTLPGDENDIGRHVTITIQAYDHLGNQNTGGKSVILDNKPPASMLSVGDPRFYDSGSGTLYVTSSTEFTFDPMDWEMYGDGVGVDYTKYRIDSGPWTDYTIPITFTGADGVHTLEYYSVDYLGNTEDIDPYNVFLDNTPPEVSIELPEDGYYVYGVIPIEILATDDGSGVHHVEYSLDEGATWLPATYDSGLDRWIGTWDTTLFSEGTHTPLARAEDNVENLGYDETPPTVTVVYLEYDIEFSDSNWNPIENFTVVFNEQKPGEYKISTNPGSLYEIITIENTGALVTLPHLIFDVNVPFETSFLGPGEKAFTLQGVKSVHVYLNGVDVTPAGKWIPSLHIMNVWQALTPGDTLEVYLHFEYAFKGGKYTDPDISSWPGEEYQFETDLLTAYGPSWISSLQAIPHIIGL